MKEKSPRNKTIDLTIEEGRRYLDRCIQVSSPVDINTIQNHTILGDTNRVLPLLPGGFAKLVIADPPYNLTKDFNGNTFRATDRATYMEYTEQWICALLPHMTEDASIYVCCDWQSSAAIQLVLEKYFTVRSRITWQREKGRGAHSNWKNGMEDIWYATRSDRFTFHIENVMQRRRVIAPYRSNGKPRDWEETEYGNFRNTYPSNFWDDISIPYWSMPENTAHPTQKPEKLLAKLILASSDPGDIVLDPFLGSGSTSVTARKLGRDFVGIEQNPQYCIWAEKRLENALSDQTIQGYTDGVFWERNTSSFQKKNK